MRGVGSATSLTPTVTIDPPDAGSTVDSLMSHPMFYTALGCLVVAALVMLVWRQVPTSLKWFALGVLVAAFLLAAL